MKIGSKNDLLLSEIKILSGDVANIKAKLLGDEYNKSMIDELSDLKISHYKLVARVQKIWIIGSMMAGILTFLISIGHYIKDFFT